MKLVVITLLFIFSTAGSAMAGEPSAQNCVNLNPGTVDQLQSIIRNPECQIKNIDDLLCAIFLKTSTAKRYLRDPTPADFTSLSEPQCSKF